MTGAVLVLCCASLFIGLALGSRFTWWHATRSARAVVARLMDERERELFGGERHVALANASDFVARRLKARAVGLIVSTQDSAIGAAVCVDKRFDEEAELRFLLNAYGELRNAVLVEIAKAQQRRAAPPN